MMNMYTWTIALALIAINVKCNFANSECGEFEFLCGDGGCVDRDAWCDAIEDCNDGSDEKYCAKATWRSKNPNNCSPMLHFLCTDGPCIPLIGRCDNIKSCEDGSDEKNCGKEVLNSAISSATVSTQKPVVAFMSSKLSSVSLPPVSHRESKDTSSYTPFHTPDYSSHVDAALRWLISQRDADFGWGAHTPRAVIALFLSRGDSLADPEEDMLMKKQLDIQLFIELARNHTKPMPLSDLSLYINALTATCEDPHNFYGHDLVAVLRSRVDLQRTRLASPLAYFTLCLAGQDNYIDAHQIRNMLLDPSTKKDIDMLSLTILAASCIVNSQEDKIGLSTLYQNATIILAHQVKTQGLPGNVYEVAILIQALNEGKVNDKTWPRSAAMDFILNEQVEGSFGDILATYHALPVISGKSLLSLKNKCTGNSKEMTPIEVLKNSERQRQFVDFSLYIGNPVEVVQKLQLNIPRGCSCLDVMRLAQDTNPNFRFDLDKNRKVPFVYSIGGIPNDAEKGLHWKLFLASKIQRGTEASLRSYTENLKNLIPSSGDEIVFWLRHD